MVEKSLSITIDNIPFSVVPFTTVAAAVALHGSGGTRRSVKGHRRTALCGMGVCHECRVTIDGRPHGVGCQTLCRDGMSIHTAQ